MQEEHRTPETKGAAARAQAMSRALADAARRARFSTRSKQRLSAGGFQARRGERRIRLLAALSFVLMVVAPALGGALYYGFIASGQYVAETQFTVMGGEVQTQDGFGAVTGIPAMAIVQDTQIVMSYVESRAAVERLDSLIGLRAMYARPGIDWIARFPADEPVEQFLRYWRRMIDVSIRMPSGIVVIKVRAFTAQDARTIAEAILKVSEELINELNTRMMRDAITNAENEFARSADRLGRASVELEKARNAEGLLDTVRAAEAVDKLLIEARSGLMSLQQEYAAQRRVVNETSPQMRVLKSRIEAARAQVFELEARLTTARGATQERALSETMTKFSVLDLERQIAEKLYAGAAAALELARIASERQMMYLNAFVQPMTPQEPLYPKRILYPVLLAAAAFALWGILTALSFAARNHMA